MMKYVLLAAVIGVALVNARPQSASLSIRNTDAGRALEAEEQILPYAVASASDDVSSVEHVSSEETLSVQGSVTFTNADGQIFTLNYVADENGFQPQSSITPNQG